MLKSDGLFGKLIKNSGWLYGGGVVNTLLTTAQAVLVARILGIENYGYLALVLATVGIVLQFADFRTWEVTIRFLPEKLTVKANDEAISFVRSLIWLDILSGLAAVGILAIINNWLAQVVAHDNRLALLIMLYGLSMPMTLVWGGTCTGVLRVLDRFDLVTAKFMFIAVIQLIAVIGVLLLGYGLVGVVVVYLLMEALNALISIVLVGYAWKIKIGNLLRFDVRSTITDLVKIRAFLSQVWLSGTIKGIGGRIDVVLLGAFTSPAVVGTYRLALDLAGALNKLGNPIQTAILPIFVEANSLGNSAKLRKLAAGTTVMLSLVVIPAVIIITILATGMVNTLVGPSYAEAGLPLIILAIGIGVNTILIWSRPLLVAKTKVASGNWVTSLSLGLQITTILLLVPQYGATGAAIATAAMYGLSAILSATISLW